MRVTRLPGLEMNASIETLTAFAPINPPLR